MKKTLLAVSLLLIPFAVQANLTPYLSFKAGYLKSSVGSPADSLDGIIAGAAVGVAHPITPKYDIRGEFEYGVSYVTMNDHGNNTDIELTTDNLMLNLYVDWKMNDSLHPYLGAAIGYSKMHGTFNHNASPVYSVGLDIDNAPVYGVMGGATYNFSRSNALHLEAKYTVQNTQSGGDLDWSNIALTLGWRYNF